jgi:hypothetical protein
MAKTPTAFAGLEHRPDLGGANGIDMQTMLLRMLTDLYLQRPTHTPEDEHYYTELALRLIDAAAVSERAAIAERLATYPSAPPAVVRRLARDAIGVAAPLLVHSPCLTAADLAAIAATCGEAHARAIAVRSPAARPTAPGNDARACPVPSEPGQALELLSGACSWRRTGTHFAGTCDKARASQLCELFYVASAPERRLILINLDYASLAPWQPSTAIQRADIRRLESAALQHSAETLVRELGRTLGISRAQARRIVNDESGEPMVVVAKAVNLPIDALQRMLLFMNPWAGESIDRIYELSALYGEISVAAARRLVALWRDAAEPEHGAGAHEPVIWRTAAESARRALAEVLRRPDRQHERRARGGER